MLYVVHICMLCRFRDTTWCILSERNLSMIMNRRRKMYIDQEWSKLESLQPKSFFKILLYCIKVRMSTMKPQYVWIQIIQNYLGFIPSDLKKRCLICRNSCELFWASWRSCEFSHPLVLNSNVQKETIIAIKSIFSRGCVTSE